MKEPRVKDIIKEYKENNITGVYKYLSQDDIIVDSSTWAGKIKKLIENKQIYSAKQLIELVSYKFLNIK